MARAPVSRANHALAVRVVRLTHAEGLDLPAYQTEGAAGLDLVAALPAGSPAHIGPGHRLLVPTGLVLELPEGFEAQVRPRSGLAMKHGITVLNAPGTIDSDYRGEIGVLLVNLGKETVTIRRGDRIAQLVIAPVTRVTLTEVAAARETARGEGGFGSTGVAAETVAAPEKELAKQPAKSPSKALAKAKPSKPTRKPR